MTVNEDLMVKVSYVSTKDKESQLNFQRYGVFSYAGMKSKFDEHLSRADVTRQLEGGVRLKPWSPLGCLQNFYSFVCAGTGPRN